MYKTLAVLRETDPGCVAPPTRPRGSVLASGYDGGDCCVCTCTSGPKFSCGISDFECVDPGASCIQEINGGTSPITECDLGLAADAYCDLVNNNEECGASRSGD